MRLASPVVAASALLVGLAVTALPGVARANERHFTYTYETAVLPPGARELELWTTPRIGRRHGHFVRFDQRVELEVGVTDRLLTAFYLNFEAVTQEVAGEEEYQTSFSFGGVSSEWKLKLMDPVADAVGLGLYFEVTGSTNELELEGKVLVDKRVGNLLLAFNAVLEQEWEFESPNETASELVLEADLAVAYFVMPGLSIGLELRNHNEIPAGEGLEHSALFVGPVIAYAKPDWWVAGTFMPQLASFGHGISLDLHEHERFNARLLFAIHL